MKIPVHPTRIVSVHSWTTESLYDLGLSPVGVENGGAQYVPNRYLARWTKAPKVTSGADVNLEKIAALKPDLIVGVNVPYLSKLYSKLSAIAPTAFAPFGKDWSSYPEYTADFTGTGTQLAALKKRYDGALAEVRKTYADKLKSLSWDVIQGGFDDGNYWIYGTQSPVGQVLTQLGARFASASAAVKGDNTNSVSYEQADLLSDADLVIYYTNNDGSPANNIQSLFDLQTFKDLKAARDGNVVGTADFLPGSYSDGIGIIDSIAKALRKA